MQPVLSIANNRGNQEGVLHAHFDRTLESDY